MTNSNSAYGLAILPIIAASFFLITLSGCAGKVVLQPVPTPISIPADNFKCEDSLPRPKGDIIMESQVGKYIASLEYSNVDCKTKLKQLDVLIKCYNDKKCNVDTLVKYIGLAEPKKAR